VLAIVQVSSERNDLSTSLETLALMYHQQAELRLNSVAAVLAPVCLLLVAALIGFVIVALFAPLISLIQSVSGPVHFHK
jgi:type IV pilus assembly protein PilC